MIPDKVEFSRKSNKWNKEKQFLMLKAITHKEDTLLIFMHLTTQHVCQAEVIEDERREMETRWRLQNMAKLCSGRKTS